MDAMRALTQGQSCSVDGTAQISNPLSTFINKILKLDGKVYTNTSTAEDMTRRVNNAHDN